MTDSNTIIGRSPNTFPEQDRRVGAIAIFGTGERMSDAGDGNSGLGIETGAFFDHQFTIYQERSDLKLTAGYRTSVTWRGEYFNQMTFENNAFRRESKESNGLRFMAGPALRLNTRPLLFIETAMMFAPKITLGGNHRINRNGVTTFDAPLTAAFQPEACLTLLTGIELPWRRSIGGLDVEMGIGGLLFTSGDLAFSMGMAASF